MTTDYLQSFTEETPQAKAVFGSAMKLSERSTREAFLRAK